MDLLFYTDAELTEKSAVPLGVELPELNFELLEFDLVALRNNFGLTIYDIEWTSEGVTTDLEQAKIDKENKEIEKEVNRCRTLVTQYQQGDTDPRLDSNFVSICISPYGQMKKNGEITKEQAPCCEANTVWMNALWQIVWEDIKAKIRAKEAYSLDFGYQLEAIGLTPNPPHDFDSCYAEIM